MKFAQSFADRRGAPKPSRYMRPRFGLRLGRSCLAGNDRKLRGLGVHSVKFLPNLVFLLVAEALVVFVPGHLDFD